MKLAPVVAAALTLGLCACSAARWELRKTAAAPRISDGHEVRLAFGDVLVVEKRDGPGMASYINATTVIVPSADERERVKGLLSAVFPNVMGEATAKVERKRHSDPDALLDGIDDALRAAAPVSVDAPRVLTVDDYLDELKKGAAGNKADWEAMHPRSQYAWKDDIDYGAERRRLEGLLRGARAVVLRYVHVETASRSPRE